VSAAEDQSGLRGGAEAAPRKLRADSVRNRERLIAAAKAAFTEAGSDVALEEIARRAGVGIGTLYRHFPARDSVVEAVYRREVEQLGEAATRLLATMAPGDALHAWMRVFVDYIATKKVIAGALASLAGGTAGLFAASGARIMEAIGLLVERSKVAGEIRGDVEPVDVLRGLVGVTYGNDEPGWQASALRLTDILMDGLRTPRS
jgi:AcrR family transcriptional regulator